MINIVSNLNCALFVATSWQSHNAVFELATLSDFNQTFKYTEFF